MKEILAFALGVTQILGFSDTNILVFPMRVFSHRNGIEALGFFISSIFYHIVSFLINGYLSVITKKHHYKYLCMIELTILLLCLQLCFMNYHCVFRSCGCVFHDKIVLKSVQGKLRWFVEESQCFCTYKRSFFSVLHKLLCNRS